MAEAYTHNKSLTSKIQIPVFDPASAKISPRAWIAYVELARDSAGMREVTKEVITGSGDDAVKTEVKTEVPYWSDKQTCTNAMLLLEGTANKWGIHILENKSEELSSWPKFKASFKERFIAMMTLNEKMNLRDLKMHSTETCRDFYDRCVNNVNLFYENEWEALILDEVNPLLPWESMGTKVAPEHITRSDIFLKRTIEIELKLAFAAGLKESIKRQVLFQESANVKDILSIAQRVESGLKELKKSDIAILDIDTDEEDSAQVGAINFNKKKKAQGYAARSGGSTGSKGKPSGQLKCYYCLKTGHFKSACITMKNDRKKGIFKSNINQVGVKAKVNSVEADSESESDNDNSGPRVQNGQTDLDQLAKLLNLHSV